jgi:hypothetical protein
VVFMHEEASPCFSYAMSASRVVLVNKDKAGTKLSVMCMYIYTVFFVCMCPVLPTIRHDVVAF